MPATVKVKDDYSIKIRRGLIERLGIEILRLNDDIENEEITNLTTDFKVIPFPVNFLANFNTQLAAQEQRIQTLETRLNELISAVTPDPEPAEQEQQG